jgi:hypothetical protein|tara:strand:- start:395 stop:607 length:213 start_codon:yes stop_codon:yes gene_type:complete
MIITLELIEGYKTKKGAWTRSQLQAIGVSYPPKKGWKKRCIGRQISEENLTLFKARLTANDLRTTKRIKK